MRDQTPVMGRHATRLAVGVALVLAVATSLRAETAAPARPAGPLGVGPAGGLTGEAQPEWLRGVLTRVNATQRQLNQALSRELRRLRGGEATSAALAVAWIAFLYGVLHAVGPGHGKLVVSSLFLARDARLRTAVGISWLVSLLQTMSAIAIVSVVALALGRGGFAVLRDSRRIELVCYGLIALIGLGMLAGALREAWVHRRDARAAADAAGASRGVASTGLVLATGLTPCASAIIILLFALGQELYLVGVAACLVMAVGMGLTVSLVGLAAVATRRGTLRIAGASSSAPVHWVKTTLGVAGAAAIAGLGLLLLLSAWTSI
jgi:ABC-type nickel/cobalt efflux system permease component RcnA